MPRLTLLCAFSTAFLSLFTSANADTRFIGRVTLADPVIYRSEKRYGALYDQSACRTLIYLIHCRWSGLLSVAYERLPPLQHAWQVSRGGTRPWSEGAAVPCPKRNRATPCHVKRETHRGCRAGVQIQRWRHRDVWIPRHQRTATVASHRDRHLTVPVRLTQRQTTRVGAADGDGAAKSPPTYTIGHVNTRSLAPKIDDINVLLQQHQFDILCITETWLRPDVSDRVLVFPGYGVTRCDRESHLGTRTKARGGGVAILFRERLRVKKLEVGGSDPTLESLWLSVGGGGRRTAVVGVLYRPPDASMPRSL